MIEILIWMALLRWLVVNATQDTVHAFKGTTSPRAQERLIRVQRGEELPGYGLSGWLGDWRDDFLRERTRLRRRRVERGAARFAARGSQPVADGSGSRRDDPRDGRDGHPGADSPTLTTERRTTPGDVPPGGGVSGPAGSTSSPAQPATPTGSDTAGPRPTTPPVATRPPGHEATLVTQPTAAQAQVSDRPTGAEANNTPTATPPAGTPTAPEQPTGRPALRLVPPAPTTPTTTDTTNTTPTSTSEENTMAVPTGETTHIQATRTFFGQMETHVKDDILPNLEKCSAMLAGNNVHPEAIAQITAAREQFLAAVGKLNEALTIHDDKTRLMEQAVNNSDVVASVDYVTHR